MKKTHTITDKELADLDYLLKSLRADIILRLEIGSPVKIEWNVGNLIEVPNPMYNISLPDGSCSYNIDLGPTKDYYEVVMEGNKIV